MQLRQSPSGPFVVNPDNGPLTFGPGARLRMEDQSSVIGDGSVVIPTLKSVIGTNDIPGNDALIQTLLAPNKNLQYGARMLFDVINTSTNIDSTVDLYLDYSIDGGATWVPWGSNQHHPSAAADLTSDVLSGRQVELNIPLVKGSDLGIGDATPSLKLRPSVSQPSYTGAAGVELYSPTTAQSSTVSKGTFYISLQECF